MFEGYFETQPYKCFKAYWPFRIKSMPQSDLRKYFLPFSFIVFVVVFLVNNCRCYSVRSARLIDEPSTKSGTSEPWTSTESSPSPSCTPCPSMAVSCTDDVTARAVLGSACLECVSQGLVTGHADLGRQGRARRSHICFINWF